MEVDDFQKQVSKFQRVSSNGSSTTTTDNSQKIATHRGILESPNDGGGGGVGGGDRSESKYGVGLGVGGGTRLCGWPTSRIVRVSRASGGKDRHSKVLTSKGLRDRRVRLSVPTAIQFYDLQDRLGYDQPSKAVEWLLKAAETSIDELPCLDPPFTGGIVADYCPPQQQQTEHKNVKSNDFEDPLGYSQQQNRQLVHNTNNNNNVVTKSPACSSTSETSKGSGLSLSNRSENRIKARERAREMVSKKEKDKETIDQLLPKTCALNPTIENSSFTDLLTGGISTTATSNRPSTETRTHWTTPPMDYFFGRNPNHSAQLIQIPQFNNQQHHHQQHQQHHFAFLQDGFVPAVASAISGGGGGESYNLNFSMTPLSSNGNASLASGFSRGTLQSNLPSTTLLPHHHLQRFQSSSSVDGSTSGNNNNNNMPFFLVPNPGSDHFPSSYHFSYGNGANSDQHKEKSKHS